MLARHAATVVLACRDPGKAEGAAARIRAAAPAAEVATLRLDLATPASVQPAADRVRPDHSWLDLPVNNAGVMMPHGRTEDDFELRFGTGATRLHAQSNRPTGTPSIFGVSRVVAPLSGFPKIMSTRSWEFAG